MVLAGSCMGQGCGRAGSGERAGAGERKLGNESVRMGSGKCTHRGWREFV